MNTKGQVDDPNQALLYKQVLKRPFSVVNIFLKIYIDSNWVLRDIIDNFILFSIFKH